MLNTWTLTVLGEMDSSLTMSRLPLPAATSRSTSISYSDGQRYVRNAPERGRAKGPRRRRSGHSIAKARLGRWLAARNRPMMEAAGKESHR